MELEAPASGVRTDPLVLLRGQLAPVVTPFPAEDVTLPAPKLELMSGFPGLAGRRSGLAALAADTLAIALAIALAAGAEHFLHPRLAVFSLPGSILRLLVTLPLLVAAVSSTRARPMLRTTLGRQLGKVGPALAAGAVLSMVAWRLANAAGLSWPLPTDTLLVLWAAASVTLTTARTMLPVTGRPRSSRPRRVAVLGSGAVATRVAERLTEEGGVEVVGFVDDDPMDLDSWIGKLADLGDICELEGIDHVVVGFSRASAEELIEALRPVQGKVTITVVPRLFDLLPTTAVIDDLGAGLTGISVVPGALGNGPRMAKRTIDVVGAAAALVVSSPLLVLVALAVKLTSVGPVLFRQERIGRDGQPFRMVKFRSMSVEHAARHPSTLAGPVATGPFPKLTDDPRVTRVGRVIRRFSIDELPQLWNVLKGEMSLVGPRPFIPDDSARIEGWAERRYGVRPGITGLWQVSGRNELTFEEMCRLDGLYVASWSVGLDLRILLGTLRAVVRRTGAY